MDDVVIIYPISITAIAIIVLLPFVAVFMGLDLVREFVLQHISIIIIISSVVSLVLSLVSALKNKSFVYILGGLIITSQLLFYVFYGCITLETYTRAGFIMYIWGIILFVLWVLYGIVNIIVTYFILGLNCFCPNDKIEVWVSKKLFKWASTILGAIGWVINLFVYLIL
jgi:hypothetical protein